MTLSIRILTMNSFATIHTKLLHLNCLKYFAISRTSNSKHHTVQTHVSLLFLHLVICCLKICFFHEFLLCHRLIFCSLHMIQFIQSQYLMILSLLPCLGSYELNCYQLLYTCTHTAFTDVYFQLPLCKHQEAGFLDCIFKTANLSSSVFPFFISINKE